jgi:AcrR family transcriptional regulator
MKKTREALNRPGTARYPKGKERVEKILKAAKNVLVKEGYGGLTMRNVALGAGTTVGNLQYYYADKDRLLHDMLEYMVTGFFEEFSAILQDPKRMAEEKLVAYIDCIFDAFSIEDKGKFYPELWAWSNHYPVAAKLMEEMYETGFSYLNGIIRQINPKLTAREIKDMTITIVGSIEGLVVFLGYRRPWAKSLKSVRDYTVSSCLHLVKTNGGRAKR